MCSSKDALNDELKLLHIGLQDGWLTEADCRECILRWQGGRGGQSLCAIIEKVTGTRPPVRDEFAPGPAVTPHDPTARVPQLGERTGGERSGGQAEQAAGKAAPSSRGDRPVGSDAPSPVERTALAGRTVTPYDPTQVRSSGGVSVRHPTPGTRSASEVPEGKLGVAPGELIGARLGEYRVLRELGRGGMGVVYEAEQESLQRRVALKVLPAKLSMDTELVERFHREAQSAGRLNHSGIVQVYGTGKAEGYHYFAMQLVEGRPLNEVIKQERISPERAARIAKRAAEALDYAHRYGVVHRDIKPSNLLLGGEDEVFISDFGLARLEASASLTASGLVIGTPTYMAPEQALGHKEAVDARSDLYSLGVTLYEMLALRPPFKGETVQTVIQQVIALDPPPVKRFAPQVSRDLETIVMKLLEKEPRRRYATGKDLAEELLRFLNGEAITARPIGWWGRWWRKARRNPVAAVASVLSVLAILGAIGYGVWRGIEDERQKQEAIRDRLTEAAQFRQRGEWEKAVELLNAILVEEPGHRETWGMKADLYVDRLQEAIEAGEWEKAAERLPLVRESDREGKYAERLAVWERQVRGTGTLKVDTQPQGARFRVYRYDDKYKLSAEPVLEAKAPLSKQDLPMGSYLAIFELEGYWTTRYLSYVERDEDEVVELLLLKEEEVPEGMVYVPAGEFYFHDGTTGEDRKLFLEGFLIDRYEVSCGDYARFLNSSDERRSDRTLWPKESEAYYHWYNGELQEGAGMLPVGGIPYKAALRYAQWRGRALPTEEQWQRAARGADVRVYPWGDDFDESRANAAGMMSAGLIRPVMFFEEGDSPWGCRNMAGNVAEMTSERHAGTQEAQVALGGGADTLSNYCTIGCRLAVMPSCPRETVGFRCVKQLR